MLIVRASTITLIGPGQEKQNGPAGAKRRLQAWSGGTAKRCWCKRSGLELITDILAGANCERCLQLRLRCLQLRLRCGGGLQLRLRWVCGGRGYVRIFIFVCAWHWGTWTCWTVDLQELERRRRHWQTWRFRLQMSPFWTKRILGVCGKRYTNFVQYVSYRLLVQYTSSGVKGLRSLNLRSGKRVP